MNKGGIIPRLERSGSLAYPPVRERILHYAIPEPNSGCWIWAGHLNAYGYAQMAVGGKQPMVHRLAYEIFRGPIPDGLQLDHKCRVRCCVNPDHLEPVTGAENTRRGIAGQRARERGAARTHCAAGHAYAEHAVFYAGRRYCGQCREAWCRKAWANYRAKQKECRSEL